MDGCEPCDIWEKRRSVAANACTGPAAGPDGEVCGGCRGLSAPRGEGEGWCGPPEGDARSPPSGPNGRWAVRASVWCVRGEVGGELHYIHVR